MRVYTNEPLIQSRAKLGKRASLIGFLVLLAGLAVSLTSWTYSFFVALACLLIGFILSNVGIFNINQWAKEPRADQALMREIKGLSNKFVLYNFSWVVPHVLLSPAGLGLFVVKGLEGNVSVSGSRWKQAFSAKRLFGFFGAEPLGNPDRDLAMYENAARKALATLLPGVEVPIRSAVVFSSPKASVTQTNPSVTVLVPKQIKAWMRGFEGEALSVEQRKTLAKAFLGNLPEEQGADVPGDDEGGKKGKS